MAKVPFNVDAYTARLIGRENIPNLEAGILELVKNTYDADATVCMIYYDDLTEELYIIDNGHGMTQEKIIRHWMTIGNSSKKENFISRKGRVQTGAKGIGRFALDRLGAECCMLTKTTETCYRWYVNWDEFENETNITDMNADLDLVSIDLEDFVSDIYNKEIRNFLIKNLKETGTIFRVGQLRDEWDSKTINRVKNKLSMIIPPSTKSNFRIFVGENQIRLASAEIKSVHIDNFDYRIKFEASQDGAILVELQRNEFDFGEETSEIIHLGEFTPKDKEYFYGVPIVMIKQIQDLIDVDKETLKNLGVFSGELFFYKKSCTEKDKQKYYYKDFLSRKDLVQQVGGIKIYRDNFKVRPYGDYTSSSFDWLSLANRSSKSPAAPSSDTNSWRVRAEQMTGEIYISRLNISLEDQANREGIIESKEFIAFKKLIIQIINLFEQDRQYVIRKLQKIWEKKNNAEKYEKEIKNLASSIYNNQADAKMGAKFNSTPISNALGGLNNKPDAPPNNYIDVLKANTVIEKKDEEIKNLEDENRLLRGLATTGIVANTYMHEMKTVTHNLGRKLTLLRIHINKEDKEKALDVLEEAIMYRQMFNEWFKVTLESIRKDRREMHKHNLNDIISNVCRIWQEALKDKQVEILVENIDVISFRCFPYEIESIINNLIANSISAFEDRVDRENNNLVIKIKLEVLSEENLISYQDNGPGLSNKYKKEPRKILDAFETNKLDESGVEIGTGMGMWIINKTMLDYKGKIYLDENKNSTNGFSIKLGFPNRGVKS